MANNIGWGQGAINNAIGWGQGASSNSISWGISQKDSYSGETEIYGIRTDADALAFYSKVTAAGGTLTATEQTAINQLVVNLKAKGLWASMKAIYPMVGSSAAACAQNLVSSSFTSTFYGGWTFTSSGALPNGTNAYMDTNFNPITQSLPIDSTHFSIYSRTNSFSSGVMIGNGVGGGTNQSNMFALNPLYVRINSLNTNTNLPTLNLQGLILAVRNNNTQTVTYKNTTAYTQNDLSSGVRNNNYTVGSFSTFYDNNQYAFASIGNGLTNTQALDFYNTVQSFNQTLNRQV